MYLLLLHEYHKVLILNKIVNKKAFSKIKLNQLQLNNDDYKL